MTVFLWYPVPVLALPYILFPVYLETPGPHGVTAIPLNSCHLADYRVWYEKAILSNLTDTNWTNCALSLNSRRYWINFNTIVNDVSKLSEPLSLSVYNVLLAMVTKQLPWKLGWNVRMNHFPTHRSLRNSCFCAMVPPRAGRIRIIQAAPNLTRHFWAVIVIVQCSVFIIIRLSQYWYCVCMCILW